MPNMLITLRRLSLNATVVIAALYIACMPAVAGDAKKILLINSDAAVDKYRQVESIFRAQIPRDAGRVVAVSLESVQSPDALEKLFRDENPALIFSIGSKAYQLASQVDSDKPMLFSSVINWQRFERRSNHYGVANELSSAQELSLLHYIFPGLRRVGVLYDAQYSQQRIAEARTQAAEVGLTLIAQNVADGDTDEALQTLLPQVDILWLIADPGVLTDRSTIENIFAAGEARRKPVYAYSDAYLNYGASLVVAADTPTIGRQAANLAQTLLRHEPLTEAVQTPAGSHITLNLCQLGKLKLDYNTDALDSVNRLLECGR
ncbi:MAG: ABC transporter substrate-binding protein [Gammaproteobacteria bacterium]